ncbi:MAG TPA: choice-of-anchor D domain-containing protein [Kiritimatiellia bacterium]|nr:choice-of-anchor D domain-containing protein [Kiritimatiellia bacterium]HMP33611.1 choice-of-anchor D domain-containing protein [Kiritimatiellia bacterium]
MDHLTRALRIPSLLLALLCVVLTVRPAQAELLLGFDLTGLAGNQDTTTNTTAAANISTVAPNARITRGSGLVAASASGSMSASSWTMPAAATIANAITSNDYFTLRVVPDAGYLIDVTNFSWRTTRSGTGPTNYVLRSSVDDFGSDIAEWRNTGTTSNFVTTVSITSSTGVEFRVYGFKTANNAGTARIADGASFGSSGIDLAIFGTVAADSAPDVDVFGNNTLIADGDTTPTVTDHTDFGAVGINQSNLVRTFTVTNSGSASLGLGTVTTSGTHAADFIVLTQPAASLAVGGSTTFQVRFDPSASGQRNATLQFTNNVTGKNPYDFAVRGTGMFASILRSPVSITVTSMVGSAPANATFGVTNVGRGRLDYTITTNVAWMSVSPVSGQLAEQAGQQETITFNATGLSAGTSNGIVTITSADASNSPHTVSLSWIITNIPNPTAASATVDGREMVRLAWTKLSDKNVLIAYREGSAPGIPADGTAYSPGDALPGGGIVVYNGSAAALEHIVRTNATHYYSFHSVNNNHYSPGLADSAITTSYGDGEIVEPVAYTNGVTLNGVNGGNGWSGAWSVGSGTYTAETFSLSYETNYPAKAANRIRVADPGNGGQPFATRSFPARTSGKLYVAAVVSYQYQGPWKFAGFSLMSNTSEKVFIGKIPNSENNRFGLTASRNATDYSVSGATLGDFNTSTGNVYVMIGTYDFGTRELKGKVYARTAAIPETEPGSWDVSRTFAVGHANSIDGIRLASGALGAPDGSIGQTLYDEIRVANTWSELLRIVAQPQIAVLGTNLAGLGTTNTPAGVNGTDFGQTPVSGGTVDRTFTITNAGEAALSVSGITTSGTEAAEFTILAPASLPLTVSPGGASNLTVRFDPAASGVRTAAVLVASNDPDEPQVAFHVSGTGSVEATVATVAGSATNTTTATVGGNVTADGFAPVTNRGVVYKTTAGVTITDNKTQSGSGTGSYTANLTGLSVNTRYYFRAYAQNVAGTALGSELEFWTWANVPSAPTVGSPTISTLNVTVNENGNPTSTLFSIQTTNNNLFVQTNGTLGATEHWRTDSAWGTISVTGLGSGSNFGFRVRAQNGQGTITAWSALGNATTLANTPTVTTTTANPTNAFTATSGGNVTADGGAFVTNRGVVWAVSPSTPTVPGTQSTNGTGTGSFTSTITNLVAGQTYNYRAFAQNSAGTAYGATLSLTTPCFSGFVTGLYASVTNDQDFTAAWTAFVGASGYILDVSTSSTFTVAADGNYGVEVFTNMGGGTTTSYLTRQWTNNGVAWTGFLARTDQTIDGSAITLQNANGSYLISQVITGGIDELRVTHQLKFTGADSFDIFVNSTKVATNIVYGSSVLTAVVQNIGVSGDFTIMITNKSGGRVALDNLTWTNGGSAASFVPGYSNRTVAGTSQAVTGLTAGVTYYFRVFATNAFCTTLSSSTSSVTTLVIAPDIEVRGNNLAIADGDLTPNVNDHTDFGRVGLVNSNLVRTFTITNNGNATLTLNNVAVGGTHAANFTVISQPSLSIAAGGSSTFQIRFDPSAVGERNATVFITNNVTGKTPFDFAIRGTGVQAGIVRSPTTINVTTMIGSSTTAGFGVTNGGLGQLIYTVSTNAAWLTVSPTGVTLGESAGQQHTVTFSGSLLAAGVSNATITLADANASNSPQTIAVTLTLTNIPDPTAVVVTNDGPELNRLSWTAPSGLEVLVVHNATNPPSTPADGTSYSAGSTVGSDGSRVVYKGSASSVQHVVQPGVAQHYTFHAVNNNHYSPGVASNVVMATYPPNQSIDQFAYTNGVSLNGLNGGVGWTNAWSDSNPGAFTIQDLSFATQTNYPATAANKVLVDPPNNTERTAFRYFDAVTTGKVYIGFMMNFEFSGASKWSGVSFYNGGAEQLFFGETGAADQRLAVGGVTSDYNLNAGIGNDYLIMGFFDFDNDIAKVNAYFIGTQSVPETEPTGWAATNSGLSGITRIDGIRLASGSSAGTPGKTYFDEIRIGRSWNDIIPSSGDPGIGVSPTNISISVMQGSTPGNQSFGVTNTGFGILNHVISTNADWISVSPVSGSLSANAGQQHTITFATSTFAPGTSNATITITDATATNSPRTVAISVTVTAIPPPAAFSVRTDGPEMNRLGWASNNLAVLVLRNSTDTFTDPTQGVAYNRGDTIGSATVIHRSSTSAVEHIVSPGSTNFYRAYAINNDYYSSGVTVGSTTTVYRANEITEQFAYTNGVGATSPSLTGGWGWTSGWTSVAGTWTILSNNNAEISFPDEPLYPTNAANLIKLTDPGSATTGRMHRYFPAVTNGQVYIAGFVAYQYEGFSKFAGLSFMNGTVETGFFGKVSSPSHSFTLGIDTYGGARQFAAYDIRGLENSTNNTYLVVGKYDFDTDRLFVQAYYRGVSVPEIEPAAWAATATVSGVGITRIDGVRIHGGADVGTIGHAYFDEVRVATNWAMLINRDPPVVLTTIASATTDVSATSGGNVTSAGSSAVTNRGVVYGTASGPTIATNRINSGTGTGVFVSTLTNLIPGVTYHYRAFAQNTAGTSYGDEYTLVAQCFTSVVTGLFANPTNSTDFTANWSALPGASSYEIDVSSSGDFGASTPASIYTNDFEGVTKAAYASGTVVIAGATWWLHDALIGTSGSDVKNGANSARIQNTGSIGMQSSTNMGLSSITLWYATYGSDGSSAARVEYSSDGWTTWSTAGTFTASSGTLTAFAATNLNVTGSIAVRIIKTSGGGNRVNIDDIQLYGYGASSYVGGYENRPVAGTSVSVTGLVSGATYYWRVRPVSAGCTGGNSTTSSVTTVDNLGPELFAFNVSNVTNTDGAINAGFAVTGLVYDAGAGLSNAVGTPYFLIRNNLGTLIAASNKFTTAPANGSTVTGALAGTFGPVAPANVTLGIYTTTVGAVDRGGFGSTSNFTMTIVDDDTNIPEQVTILSTNTGGGSLRFMQIAIGAANITLGGGATTNLIYPTTDGALAGVSASNPLLFWLGARDDSGLNRGTTGPSTNMSFTLDGIVISNTANFDASRSSTFAGTSGTRPTNVWTWTAPFSSDDITTLMTNTVNGLGTNRISASLHDADNDRIGDSLSLIDRQYGYLVVTDDDTAPPVYSAMTVDDIGETPTLISESFEGLFPPTGWDQNSSFAGNDPRTGNSNVTFNGSGDWIRTPLLTTPSYITFWYKRSANSDSWSAVVEWSANPTGSWTTLSTISSISTSYQIYSNSLTAYTNIYIRIRDTRPSGSAERRIDDVEVGNREQQVVTDGQIAAGGYPVKALLQDTGSGIAVSNAWAPRFVILNTNSQVVVSNFFTTLFADGNTALQQLSNTVGAAISTNLVTLGTNTAFLYATDADNDRTDDRLSTTGGPLSVLVVDDDTDPPVPSGFQLAGATTNLDLTFSSVAITGVVTDASGLAFGGTSYLLVFDSLGGVVQSNALYAGAGSAVTATVFSAGLSCGEDYTVRVFAADADFDRPGDQLAVTQNVMVIRTTGVGTPSDYPRATNLLVNGSAASLAVNVTDAAIASGSWSLAMTLTHPIGVQTNSESPYFRVTNGLGIAIGATRWSNAFVSGTAIGFTNTTLPTVAFTNVALGTYAVVWSASNLGSCVASIIDRDVIDGGTNLFTVIDDDTAAPVLSAFAVNGSGSTIDVTTALSGFSVTGLVQDAGSGLAFTSQPAYFLFLDTSGAILASNTVTGLSEGAGLGSPVALTNWFSGLLLTCGNTYTVRVVAADADADRLNDRSTTNGVVLVITTSGAGGDSPNARDLLITNTPAASAFLTDAQISTGGWRMAMTISHPSGDIVTNGPGAPSYLVYNPSNLHAYTTTPLTWATIAKSGSDYFATNTMPAADYTSVMTGYYSIVWSAQSEGLCFGSTNASTTVSPGTNRFLVIDDDTNPPNFFGLNVGGGSGTGCGGPGVCPDPTRTNLVAGDIAIFAMNTLTRGSGPTATNMDAFAFVTLVDIPAGTRIRFTDNGWRSSTASFRNNEGTLVWRATNCVAAGTVVRWVATNTPVFNVGVLHQSLGSFSPNIQGEQILAYQGTDTNPQFIYALNDRLTGVWDVDAVDSHSSALPPGLVDGFTAVAVGEFDNVIINTNVLAIGGSREDILFYIGNQENWIGDDFAAFNLSAFNFTFPDVCSSAGTITDEDIFLGGWTITGLVQDVFSGVAVSNEAGLRYVVMNTNGGQVASNYFATTFPAGTTTLQSFSNGVAPGTYAFIQLGTYTAQVHVADTDNDRPFDAAARSTNIPFNVVDDDTDPPQIGFFTINGQTTLTNPAELVSVVISGQVRDTTSGIAFNTEPPVITVLDSFGGIAYTGLFTFSPTNDGDAVNWEPIITSSINLSGIADCGTYTVRVTVADADNDRVGDRLVVTQQFLIAVTDGSGAEPEASDFYVNDQPAATALITDGDLAAGGYSLAITISHPAGVAIDPPFTPTFTLRDPTATDVYSSDWSNIVTAGTTMYATNSPLEAIPYGSIHTGAYSLLWSARSLGACYGEVIDSAVIVGGTNRFIVVDDDRSGVPFSNLTYNSRSALLFATSFEDGEGWSNTVGSTYQTTAMTPLNGTWQLTSVAASTSDEPNTPDRNLRLVTGSLLELPLASQPGTLFYAARASSGTATNYITAEYATLLNAGWVAIGVTNAISGTNYATYSLPIDYTGIATVRLVAVSVASPSVYVDDLALTRYLSWTNTTAINLAWANATLDASGVYQYRYDHNPTSPPLTLTAGDLAATNNASFSSGDEGVITGYVFMVDNDNDRANDRARGMNVPYVTRIDLTPPAVITNLALSNDILDVADDTSEIKVSWNPPANETVGAGPRGDGEPLSPWYTYRIYYTDAETGPTSNDNYLAVSTEYPELGNIGTGSIIMSNLVMGIEYRIAVAGVDAAGNIGPLSDVETKRLNVFTITQAFVNASGDVVVQWVGLNDRPYDVIYTDATGYSDAINGSWRLAQTVIGTNFVDLGGLNEGSSSNRPHPRNLPYKTMRFYRVAPVNGWIPSLQRVGAASEQVIVAMNAELVNVNGVNGYNFIGKGMVPLVNTLEEFLGVNRLPAGNSIASATQVILYEPNAFGQPNATNYWLSSGAGPGWLSTVDDSPSDHVSLPATNRGFSIFVPSSTNLLLVGRVPWTNAEPVLILTSAYNILSLNMPRPTRVRELGDSLGLRTNLVWGLNVQRADEIRILQRGYGPYAQPKARIFVNTTGQFTFVTGGTGSAENFIIEADDAVIIHVKSNAVPYELDFSASQLYPPPQVEITNALPAAPTVQALAPINVSGSGATLLGTVNPNRLASTAYFRYGTTTNYGAVSATTNLPATNIALSVSLPITGLSPGTLYHIQLVASNSAGVSRFGTRTFITTCASVTITNTAMPNGTLSSIYSNRFGAAGGAAPYTFTISGGNIPSGLSLGANGVIAGTPSSAGVFSFLITATDSNGCFSSPAAFDITITNNCTVTSSVINVASVSAGTSTAAVTVAWNDGANEEGYQVWRHTVNLSAGASLIGTTVANATNYLDAAAVPGTVYYYWIKGTNCAGASAFGAGDAGYRRLATVTGVSASDDTYSTKVMLVWNDIDHETGYGIWRGTTASYGAASYLASVTANTTSYDDNSATAGVTYYYWVRATNSSSSSLSEEGTPDSGSRSIAGLPILSLPTVSNISANAATLGAQMDSFAGPLIARGTVWGVAPAPTGNSLAEGGTSSGAYSHVRSGLPAGTLIYYRGWGTNAVGIGYSGDGTFWTAPTNVVLIGATNRTSSGFTALWSATGGATNYLIDVSTTTVFSVYAPGYSNRLAGNVTSFSVTGLTAATPYYWRVRAQNAGGLGNYSLTNLAYTVAAEPTVQSSSLVFSNVTATNITVQWTPGNGSQRVLVGRMGSPINQFPADGTPYTGTNLFGAGSVLGTNHYILSVGTTSQVVVKGLDPGTTYFFRAFELNGSGQTVNYLTNNATGNPLGQATTP